MTSSPKLMDALDPSLFIGSSSEALRVAKHLQSVLANCCEPTVWNQGIFGPSSSTLSELLEETRLADFAALLLTPDDEITSRGETMPSARDNVIFELGLFLGALGAPRVFLLTPEGATLHLPNDLAGVTCLTYKANRRDGNLKAALGPCALEIENRVKDLGIRPERARQGEIRPAGNFLRRGLSLAEEQMELERELDALAKAATAQGWIVKTRTATAFRIVSTNGQRYSITIGSPAETRDALRDFAQQLKTAGLRVSSAVLNPV